ncbi:MAG: hypothetical protein II960_01915 [Synergistaceae bacterium]|nr:hypothetical protein [Synergistaceae bacterium]
MKVEYDLVRAPVTYEQEKELGEDPLRLDFLIIKKEANVELSDPIGKFFKRVNLFEYKSPEDGLTIDDFYKAQGYGLIYKGFDRKVNELPINEITLTLVRHSYPRDLIKLLRETGFKIIETHSGIFEVEGKISIPVQIVVSSKLPDGEYDGLKLLSKGATAEGIIDYVEKANLSENENIRENVKTVIGVCLSVNKKLSEELKEAGKMNDIFKDTFGYLFEKDFYEAEQKGIQEGIKEGIENANVRVAKDMLKENLPLSLIEKISKLSEDVIRKLAVTV